MSEAKPGVKLVKVPPKAAPAAKTAAAAPAPVAPATPAAKKAPAPIVATKTAVKPVVAAVANTVAVETVDTTKDLIVQVVHSVENMTEAKAFAAVPDLLDGIDASNIKLGGVLSVINSQGWFMNKGYETFRAFVEGECAIEYRKAMYLIAIYNGLAASGVAWADVGHLGWTKLKELASILTQENVKEWVAQAENMTVLQLQEHIKAQKAAATPQASDAEPTKVAGLTTMTFKLHDDQKKTVREGLDKVKKQMNTEVDSVALEHMCMDYIAGDGKALKGQQTLKQMMTGKSAEEVLGIFGEVFPDVSLEVTLPA